MTTEERAQVFVDGAALPEGTSSVQFDPAGVAGLTAVGGNIYVTGNNPGTTTMTVSRLGRSGTITVVVTTAPVVVPDPLVITLGTPEPKG